MFDHSRLRGRIKRILGTEQKFGELMGLSSTSVTKKLNSERGFNQKEILCACKILHIDDVKIHEYFFELVVR